MRRSWYYMISERDKTPRSFPRTDIAQEGDQEEAVYGRRPSIFQQLTRIIPQVSDKSIQPSQGVEWLQLLTSSTHPTTRSIHVLGVAQV
jgi:hypothetical protein